MERILKCLLKHVFEQGLLLHDHGRDVQSVAILSLICTVCITSGLKRSAAEGRPLSGSLAVHSTVR